MQRVRLIAVVLAAATTVAAGGSNGHAPPACFGAAARDPQHPCTNPSLRLSVVPSPAAARALPNAPCLLRPFDGGPHVCAFGVAPAVANASVALVGDSHAGDWRGALRVVAEAKGWLGLSITHSSCPLSTATRNLPGAARERCQRWRTKVRRWFAQHPEVNIAFVSALSGGASVVARGGDGAFATAVAGYMHAWRDLPASVRHVVVLRDTPKMRSDTGACVQRAMSRHVRASPACAVVRSAALDRDPMAVAAARMRTHRVQIIDLTRVFCGNRLCYPVIGGALVYKDSHHLTASFSATLGPLVQRRLEVLMAGWG
jgi:hypothetical protein